LFSIQVKVTTTCVGCPTFLLTLILLDVAQPINDAMHKIIAIALYIISPFDCITNLKVPYYIGLNTIQ